MRKQKAKLEKLVFSAKKNYALPSSDDTVPISVRHVAEVTSSERRLVNAVY